MCREEPGKSLSRSIPSSFGLFYFFIISILFRFSSLHHFILFFISYLLLYTCLYLFIYLCFSVSICFFIYLSLYLLIVLSFLYICIITSIFINLSFMTLFLYLSLVSSFIFSLSLPHLLSPPIPPRPWVVAWSHSAKNNSQPVYGIRTDA